MIPRMWYTGIRCLGQVQEIEDRRHDMTSRLGGSGSIPAGVFRSGWQNDVDQFKGVLESESEIESEQSCVHIKV